MARAAKPSYLSRMNQRAIISEFKKLSLADKAELLDTLWDEYSREEELRELSDAEVAELNRRMEAYRADPSTAIEADEVFKEMRDRIAASE